MYKNIAEKYDQIFQFNPQVIAFLDDLLPVTDARILDIGCGTGKYIGNLGTKHMAYGIDPDADSIGLAASKFPEAVFEASDLFSYKTSIQFDLIFSIGNVISHIPKDDLPGFVRHVGSLLKDGGIWVFHTMNWDEILKQDTYAFPVIEKEGLRFERRYENISGEGVDFITRLSDIHGDELKQAIRLYPQSETRIMEVHRDFDLLAIYGNYAKQAASPQVNSRVYIFKKY